MRTLIFCAAAAALTLTACQRPAEETAEAPMPDYADAEAAKADAGSAGSGAARSSAPAADSSARAAGDASADTAGTATADETADDSSPVSQSTRDGAKEKAESTNLHPRT